MTDNRTTEKRVHAMTTTFRNLCGGRGSRTSIVQHSRDTLWKLVTCKRCLKLRFQHGRYIG